MGRFDWPEILDFGLDKVAYAFSKEEEWALVQKARNGDPFAKAKLERELTAHLKRYTLSRRRANSLLSDASYINEVMVQLPRLLKDYDPSKNVTFKAYVEQRANGLFQNLNDTYVGGSSMNRNERPIQAKYNMARQYVESVTPGGKASDRDILRRIHEEYGEKWDTRKLNVAKQLNVKNLRSNFETDTGEGDVVSHRDQFTGGGVKTESYYDKRALDLEREEVAKYDPSLTEDERRMILSFLKTKSKLKTSIETNETVYNLNKALNKFEGLLRSR